MNNPQRGLGIIVGYRPEIDGLRAIAVVSVVLFHAGIKAFAGGYVGVDVFFVISGFLITTILLKELDAKDFSIVRFYERRARRILPAMFFVLGVTVCFAWKIFLPTEFKIFGQGVTSAVFFAANVYLYKKNNDYFGLQSEQNPILHLWSLAVEEQYYVVFPVLLFVIWRAGLRWVWATLAILALLSLAGAHFASSRTPGAAFYLIQYRAWELLLGSLLALGSRHARQLPSKFAREALGIGGLGMIVVSIIAFDRATPFPSLWALLPTVGTALVILYADSKTFVGRILGSPIPVGIGLISFSLYLWHQPIFALNRVLSRHEPSVAWLLALSVGSAALAYLTWRFVETPFRRASFAGRRTVFALAGTATFAFAAFGILGHLNSGYPERSPIFARLVSNFGLSLDCNGNYTVDDSCSTSAAPEVAILGNSYAMHLVEGFRHAYPERSIVQLTLDACEPHSLDQRIRAGKMNCSKFLDLTLKTIDATTSVRTVIISSPFSDLLSEDNALAFERTVDAAAGGGKRRVYVFGPTPSSGADFGKCFVLEVEGGDLTACDFLRDEIQKEHFGIVDRLRRAQEREGFEFVDLTNYICDESVCHSSMDGVFIYRDAGHLSREGSRRIFEEIRRRDVIRFE